MNTFLTYTLIKSSGINFRLNCINKIQLNVSKYKICMNATYIDE